MTNNSTVRVRNDGGMSRAARGFAVGVGVTVVVTVLARGVAALVNTLWPTPDANIGLGLLLLAAVIFLAALFASPVDPASVGSLLFVAAAIGVYTGTAAWAAGRLS
jgi:hypothetical protein